MTKTSAKKKAAAKKATASRTVAPPKVGVPMPPSPAEIIAKASAPSPSPSIPPMPTATNVVPIKPKIEKEPVRQRRDVPYTEKDLKRVHKVLDTVGVASIEDMKDADEMRRKLADLAVYEEETLVAQAQDEDLKDAKGTVRELNAPYKETLDGIRARRRLIVDVAQKRGYDL